MVYDLPTALHAAVVVQRGADGEGVLHKGRVHCRET